MIGEPGDDDGLANPLSASGRDARKAILTMLDYANLEVGFPRIVQWLRDVPAEDRDRLLNELEAIAATDPARREEATYLLDGLRGIRWNSSGSGDAAVGPKQSD